MKSVKLPPIVETAKKRPLGIDPHTGSFIYYQDLELGIRIVPIESLSDDLLVKLSMKRHLTNEPSNPIVTLNGQVFTNEQAALEIQSGTKIGKQLFRADIEYLKYYLSTFPKECFR